MTHKRKITVSAIQKHLEHRVAVLEEIVKHDTGGIIYQTETRGELNAISDLLDTIKCDCKNLLYKPVTA